VKVAIDAWTLPAGVEDGRVFRSVNRADRITGDGLGEKVVWQLIKPYAEAAGVPGIAPHDLRRTCAKLCRAGGGELEQIQLLLGHASVQTTERYLGTKQDLVHAPQPSGQVLTWVSHGALSWFSNNTPSLSVDYSPLREEKHGGLFP
jgi:integrase